MLNSKLLIFFVCVLSLLATDPAISQDYCFEDAGKQYDVSPLILWAISKKESGFNPSAINFNQNGTYDYCHMQINSSWAAELGEKVWASIGDPCQCTMVGAWILSRCIKNYGYSWKAVGCYHSQNQHNSVKYSWRICDELNKHEHVAKIKIVAVTPLR